MGYNSKHNGAQVENLLDSIETKQEKLVSGKNIKTINGYSILGSGNLAISGGGGDVGYSAKISLTTPQFNAVLKDSAGHYIEFTFDTTNSAGESMGEGVTCTYTITRGTNQSVITEKYRYNTKVRFGVDKYLQEGANDIVINIVGDISGLSTSIGVTFQVVNLVLDTHYELSSVYDLSNKSYAIVEVPFTLSGYGTKIMEWYVDGEALAFVKDDDEVVDVTATRTKYITISNLSQGTHSLQVRAYTVVNGEQFFTDTMYYDMIVYTGVNQELIIGVSASIPSKYGVIKSGEQLNIYDAVQYETYILKFATYSPTSASSTLVSINVNNDEVGVVSSINGIENTFRYIPTTYGSKTLILRANDKEYIIPMIVGKTSMNIDEITTSLALDFNASGRSNNSTNKDSWSFGNYKGTFNGFNWNETSGWVNGRLEMNAGSSLAIDYAPLATQPTNTGKTIEIEWMTKNVTNDNAVICDLRGENGVGILITATKVSMTSADGVTIDTEYKSDETVRIGFVINKVSGVANQKMSFIYSNGILSRGEKWGVNDNYNSDKQILFSSTTEVEVSLKSIRIYDMALTSDQILNNYTLYRDTVAEMLEVYHRNDIYIDGTTTFSPDKMMSRLPVMIVTGDIPTLENTSDKDTQIVVDIEYNNLQNPNKSFKMKGAAMRPQGTSSMGYPKKNFRIYTQKVDGTILYDANGNVVEDKLYAFTEKSQPVDCWCLKADYAESSGTHNTGIARLWNNALINAQVEGEYICRTEAQKAAIEAGYEYDVRTTIDGFPILLFYRPTENDNVIFIGKYNFNNDKSTESVFGFKGIPNFNNEKMQCWEVLNNGNALALFTTVDGFDEGWAEAFESRYPDTKTPYTGDLKAFCEWMVNVSQEDFAVEKWEHLNVYMMAAYWCYLMRHAAADQFVKNAMFTSEDGQHFYYILYDNDTINGLINTGHLEIEPTDDRQTINASGEYVFAGHDSRLWNMLEVDEEFKNIVSSVDNALYSAGISYANTIKMFDEEQADKWVEKVYNQDAQYKYVGPYVEKGINNLFMLQGKRDLHRKWWLAKRFSIYDAKYVSGTYKSQAIELKCINGTPSGQTFKVTAGYPLDYGYGINNVPREFGIPLSVGESREFTTREVVNRGDPIRIYGAPHIAELDLSPMASRLAVVTIANVYEESLGTKLTKLVLGKSGVNNLEVTEISGLKQAVALEHLDIRGFKNLTSLDLSSHTKLKTLIATASGATSFIFAKGAPVEHISFPAGVRTLELTQLPYLHADGVTFEALSSLETMNVTSCPNVSNDFDFVYDWYASKTIADERTSLTMDNVDWKNVDVEKFIEIAQIGRLSLKGKVYLNSITLEQMNILMAKFGETAFNEDAEFFIDGPANAFVLGKTELLEGTTETYKVVTFGGRAKSIQFSLYNGSNSYTSVTQEGVLTVKEGFGQGTFTMRVIITTEEDTFYKDVVISVAKRIYPTASNLTIEGSESIENDYQTYILSYPDDVNGEFDTVWNLTTNEEGYVEKESYDDFSCTLKRLQETYLPIYLTLTATLTKKVNGAAVAIVSKEIVYVNETVAETDAGIVAALYAAGLCSSDKFISKDEAAKVTASDLQPGTSERTSIFSNNSKIKSFDGFQYFTQITEVPEFLFQYSENLASIKLPSRVISIGSNAFFATRSLKSIELPKTLASIGDNAFYSSGLESIDLHEGIAKVGQGILCRTKITELTIPSSFGTVPMLMCSDCANLAKVTIKEGIAEINSSAFAECANLREIHMLNETSPVLKGTPFGSTTREYTGRNTYNAGVNTLYVPVGATGYDIGEWKNTLLNPDKCGFHAFGSLTINSNRKNAQFSVTYSTISGTTKQVVVGVGTCYLNDVQYNTSMTIVPITTGVGEWDWTTKTFIYSKDNNVVENNAYILPADATIVGESNPVENGTYTWSTTTQNVDDAYIVEWSLSGEIATYITIESQSKTQCVLKVIEVPADFVYGTLTLVIKKPNGTLLITTTKSLGAILAGVVITTRSNAPIQAALYNAGLVANENYSLKEEVEKITDTQLNPSASDNKASIFYNYRNEITSFDELEHFIGLKTIPYGCFNGCTKLKSVKLPPTITEIKGYAFSSYANTDGCPITDLIIPEGVVKIDYYSFLGCTALKNITLPSTLTKLGSFRNANALESINIPKGLTASEIKGTTSLPEKATNLNITVDANHPTLCAVNNVVYTKDMKQLIVCKKSTAGEHFIVPNGVEVLYNGAFYGQKFSKITLPSTIIELQSSSLAFNALQTLEILALNIPIVDSYTFGGDTSNYTGRDNYNKGTNKLIIPIGGTGYDSGYWKETLLNSSKCGFSLNGKLTITSNKSDAKFEVRYTTQSGVVKSGVAGVGDCYLCEIYNGAKVTILPASSYPGESCEPRVFAYGEETKVQDMQFETVTGVFVHHITGAFYTSDSWKDLNMPNDEANGVAVIVGVNTVVLAKKDVGSDKWGAVDSTVGGATTTSEKDAAMSDMAGLSNTNAMIAALTSGAAFAARDYIFPNGEQGYLPACGELILVASLISEVDSVLTMIGGDKIGIANRFYWSSTQCDASNAYHVCLTPAPGRTSSFYKSNHSNIRPFLAIN